jgi:hypothetical protein
MGGKRGADVPPARRSPSLARVDQVVTRTLRAATIRSFPKLMIELFSQNFCFPCCAIALDNASGAEKSMGFGGVVTNAHSHIQMERTYCRGTGRF